MARPVCITGMHRSGTSMVARVAHELGLYLGHPDDLAPGAPDNPDGFFEHAGLIAASDALFEYLGAGWDCPPVLSAADLDDPGLAAARSIARPIIAGLAVHDAWAWKDPRVAPVLPFWVDLVGDVGVVVCVRNPLEVAASLRARNASSLALGIRLWFRHMQAVADADVPRLVTHYDAWFHRPEEEIDRLAHFAGIEPTRAALAAASVVPARHRRHSHFDAPSLRRAGLHDDVVALYARLTAEADWTDGATASVVGPRSDIRSAPPTTGDEPPVGQVRPSVVDVGAARYEVFKRNGRIAQLEARLAHAEADTAAADDAVAPPWAEDIRSSVYDLQLTAAELTARIVHGIDAEARARDIAYARMIRDVRDKVRRSVPADADVLVITEGEPALLDLHGRPARHFPVGRSPHAPGHHPGSDAEAVAHLVVHQALGATHLVIPSTGSWWLGAYPALADRLTRAGTVISGDDKATIVRLHQPVEPGRWATLGAALAAVRRDVLGDVSVLDTTAAGVGATGAFRPPDPSGALPYLDATVDVVVVDTDAGPERLADAVRVASNGVLAGDAGGWCWAWRGPAPTVAADIVVSGPPVRRPGAFLDELIGSLPAGHLGEVLVVAPPDATEPWQRAAGDRCTVTGAAIGTVLADVAGRSGAAHVVLVDGSTIPLEGWLPALLAPFARSEYVGLVAGRRRMVDGSAIVAAHAVAGDRLEPTLGIEGDQLSRPIDIAVPGIVAWRRDVLAASRLDDAYATLDFALADHCWALAGSGYECLVQPGSETADLGLGPASPAALAADRARLDEVGTALR